MKVPSIPDFLPVSPDDGKPLLSIDANNVHRLNRSDVCSDKQLLRWPHGRCGGWEGVLCNLGGTPTPHHQQSPSKFSAARPHSRSDLKVIGTDKFKETVICGISWAVCLAAVQSSGQTGRFGQTMGGMYRKLSASRQRVRVCLCGRGPSGLAGLGLNTLLHF